MAEAEKEYTHLEVEAALCVWECLNEWTLASEDEVEAMRVNCDSEHTAMRLEWIEMRRQTGASEMRSQSIVLGKWCLEMYDIITKHDPDFFDYWSYDWEVIPAMLKHAISKDGKVSMYRGGYVYTGGPLIDPHSAAPLVAQEFAFEHFEIECRFEAKDQWGYEELIEEQSDRVYQAFTIGDEPKDFVKWLGEKYDLTPRLEWERGYA